MNGRNRTPYRVGDSEKVLGEIWDVRARYETLGLDGSRRLVVDMGPAEPETAEVEAEWLTKQNHEPGTVCRSVDDPEPVYVVQSIELTLLKQADGPPGAALRMTLVDLLTHEREQMGRDRTRDAYDTLFRAGRAIEREVGDA